MRDAALSDTGRLDIWVNNAGRAGAFGPILATPENDFLATTDTVIRGTSYGSLAALDAMTKAGGGDLINLLGRGDDGPVKNQAAYGSAKTWVRALTGALAGEIKDSGVRVHAFNPGLVRTDMLGRIDAVRGYGSGLNRFGSVIGVLGLDADEAARPVLDLIGSDRLEYRGTAPPCGCSPRQRAIRWRGCRARARCRSTSPTSTRGRVHSTDRPRGPQRPRRAIVSRCR